ncbi:autophagy-related protein 13-domain-containing protein [Mucor mucedo]|uniref:autophagy-related protein 13-domain-containing protein n=1 Tax=Mucor mucedo TaxID=29922 RepID=UPI00221FA320|nr:autophagy-related protein 13-domain-containing protein [Mucor mucedo]KAI7893288.1 autophagy-related protein 13-domain-containing protein [Mucor mucedo]
MQSTIQPSVAPNGPSTSTRNSKLDQIIQNFYTKTAQIIVQGRCTPNHDSRYGKRNSLTKKINKWFNIATEDVDVLREDLKYWRQMAIQSTDKDPPVMIIDVYLDTSKLSHHQSLAVADDNLRWGGVELKSQTSDAHIDRILIESWELTLKYPLPQYAVDLPSLYKRSIVFFRALHSTVRLLPAHDLYRKLHKSADPDLSIGCRLTSKVISKPTEIALGSTILENDARNPTKTHTFSDIVTPMGTFGLNVTYRRNCDFKVEDAERDLSAQFIDMDEQFFTPTMAKYQQEFARPRPVSMYSPIIAREIRQQSFSPSDPQEIQPRIPRTTNRDSSASSSSRRASVPYVVSPFKSPFLASSPQGESIFSTARNYTPPSSSEKSRVADSGSFGRKIEFSSSFDKYKSSPTSRNVDASGMMMRRSSRASDHSLLFKDNDHDEDDLEDFVRFVGSNQELRLFQLSGSSESSVSSSKVGAISHFQNLRETHTSLSESLSSSIMISQHEPHSVASASTPTPPPPPSISGISPVSSTSSSTGRSYQPIIPSPLHVEQKKKSTSPVHIPQSYPQLRSLTNPSNALRIVRVPLSQDEEEENNQDMFTYSTYPQGGRHQDLHTLRTAHSHVLGKATTVRAKSPVDRYEENYSLQRSRNTEGSSLMQDHSTTTTDIHSSGQGRTHSLMMDDDDSLVFKMSEIECEGGVSSNTENNMVFHHRLNPQDLFSHEQFLELTPTPPVINRLQAISMSTVTEEEGLSTSGSSNKSESPKLKHHPFNAW